MKRRSIRPLLRQALVAGTLLACSDEAAHTQTPKAETPAPVEKAEKRRIWVSVYLPEGANPKGPVTVILFSENGKEPLVTKTFPRTGEKNQTVTWESEIALPMTVRAEVVVPADDDPTSKNLDYVGAGIGKEGKSPGVFVLPRVTVLEATLKDARPKAPVYANTKGSHHFQDAAAVPPAPPKPRMRLRITREKPLIPAYIGSTLRVSLVEREGKTPLYNTFIAVPRFPLDLSLFLPPKAVVPKDARLVFEIHSAGGKERANLTLGPPDSQANVILKPQ